MLPLISLKPSPPPPEEAYYALGDTAPLRLWCALAVLIAKARDRTDGLTDRPTYPKPKPSSK